VSPRRLLVVVPSLTSYRTFLTGVAAAWTAVGGRVMVAAGEAIARGEADRHPDSPHDVLPLPSFRAGDIVGMARAATALRRAVASYQPDIVHAHFLAAAAVAACARRPFGRPPPWWIATFHGLHGSAAAGLKGRWLGTCEAMAAARMDECWVLSEDDRRHLARRVPRSRVHCHASSGLGCDLSLFDPARYTAASRLDRRRAVGLGIDDVVVAYVGRCVDFKGFGTVVRAFWKAAERCPAMRLLVVGTFDTLHATGLDEADIARLRGDRRVAMVGWQEDVAPWLAIADIVTLPSRREGMSVVLMEALAMGVPVITRDARGCREIVRDACDGIVLRDPTDASVASAMELLASDGRLRADMSRWALAGRGRFARELYVREQIAVYDRLLRQADRSPSAPEDG
jgi:glycosyltransferase involved in cell wall biosynthesis